MTRLGHTITISIKKDIGENKLIFIDDRCVCRNYFSYNLG